MLRQKEDVVALVGGNLALVSLPDSFADGDPLDRLSQVFGLLPLLAQQLLVGFLRWILFQGQQIRAARDRQHMANGHGQHRSTVGPVDPKHVVTAKLGSR